MDAADLAAIVDDIIAANPDDWAELRGRRRQAAQEAVGVLHRQDHEGHPGPGRRQGGHRAARAAPRPSRLNPAATRRTRPVGRRCRWLGCGHSRPAEGADPSGVIMERDPASVVRVVADRSSAVAVVVAARRMRRLRRRDPAGPGRATRVVDGRVHRRPAGPTGGPTVANGPSSDRSGATPGATPRGVCAAVLQRLRRAWWPVPSASTTTPNRTTGPRRRPRPPGSRPGSRRRWSATWRSWPRPTARPVRLWTRWPRRSPGPAGGGAGSGPGRHRGHGAGAGGRPPRPRPLPARRLFLRSARPDPSMIVRAGSGVTARLRPVVTMPDRIGSVF